MWIKHFCIVTLFESLNWYSSRLSSCLAGHNVDYYRRGVEDYTCIQYSGVTREGGGAVGIRPNSRRNVRGGGLRA